MEITAATISQLQAGKNYYLSPETGTIREANIWQWFKCATGFGDGREKVRRLAVAVRDALLAAADIDKDDELSRDIESLDTTSSLSGADILRIARRFKTAHAEDIARCDAYHCAEKVADEAIDDWSRKERVLPEEESLANVRRLALYSVQHLLVDAYSDRPDSYKNDPAGFARKLRMAMERTINAVNSVEMMQNWHGVKLGYPASNKGLKRKMPVERFRLDELHFRAVLAALITTERGPAPLPEFNLRIMLFNEEILQERKEAFADTPLAPPKTELSGYIFASSAMKAFKEMESSEWHRFGAN